MRYSEMSREQLIDLVRRLDVAADEQREYAVELAECVRLVVKAEDEQEIAPNGYERIIRRCRAALAKAPNSETEIGTRPTASEMLPPLSPEASKVWEELMGTADAITPPALSSGHGIGHPQLATEVIRTLGWRQSLSEHGQHLIDHYVIERLVALARNESSQWQAPEGYALVPLEPTPDMIGAAHSSFNAIPDPGKFDPARHYRCMVRAWLNAQTKNAEGQTR